jgi:anti-sigma regulatory factor (Ser/Thr protein kinase)
MSSYLRVPLTRSASSGREAREIVRTWLADVGRSRAEYVSTQVVTELVTNAVVHAHEPIALHLWVRRDGVRIGVSDGSTAEAVLLPDDPSAPAGRGLRLVARLTSDWGSDVHDRGKITWAEVTERSSLLVPDDPGDASPGRGAQWHLGWRGEGATLPSGPLPARNDRPSRGRSSAGSPVTTRARQPERWPEEPDTSTIR